MIEVNVVVIIFFTHPVYKIAKCLLPLCNNLDAKDQDGKTALDLAYENGHHEVVRILKYVSITHKALEN